MKFLKQVELEALLSKVHKQEALSSEELQAFVQLNAELASWKTDCTKVLDEVVQQIVRYGITLEQLRARRTATLGCARGDDGRARQCLSPG